VISQWLHWEPCQYQGYSRRSPHKWRPMCLFCESLRSSEYTKLERNPRLSVIQLKSFARWRTSSRLYSEMRPPGLPAISRHIMVQVTAAACLLVCRSCYPPTWLMSTYRSSQAFWRRQHHRNRLAALERSSAYMHRVADVGCRNFRGWLEYYCETAHFTLL